MEADEQSIKKIYAAVTLANLPKRIVIDDFFKNESREFENIVKDVLTKLLKAGKRIIYLSCEIYDVSGMNEDLKPGVVPINLDDVTLR